MVDGQVLTAGQPYRVVSRAEQFDGRVFRVLSDEVETPAGERTRRDYLRHLGAVAVVALDQRERVVLVRQYRHALGGELWELPAGLVDVPGETLPELAARELAEETDLVADRLDLLLDLHPSPGVSDERIRIFLARGLARAPGVHPREFEEATMTVARFGLDDAVGMIFDGQVTNGPAVAGLLAAARARDQGWAPLRPCDLE
jgi:ADP-ribose pyrophosphatase